MASAALSEAAGADSRMDLGGSSTPLSRRPATSSPRIPHAFCLAACLDGGTRAEIIRTIPLDLSQALGHLDPTLIDRMDLARLADVFATLSHRPTCMDLCSPRTTVSRSSPGGTFEHSQSGMPLGSWGKRPEPSEAPRNAASEPLAWLRASSTCLDHSSSRDGIAAASLR